MMGRLTLWRSEHDADHVAASEHVEAVESQIMQFVEPETHRERSFYAHPGPAARAPTS